MKRRRIQSEAQRLGRRKLLQLVGASSISTLPLWARSGRTQTVRPMPSVPAGPPAKVPKIPSQLPVETVPTKPAGRVEVQAVASPPHTILNFPARVLPPGTHRFSMRVSTAGSGQLAVTCQFREGPSVLATTSRSVAAGSRFDVDAELTLSRGVHSLLGTAETGPARASKDLEVTVHDMAAWVNPLYEAVRFAVDRWKLAAKFSNIVINGVTAVGGPGCLLGPQLEPLIASAPSAVAKVPKAVRDAFAKIIGARWRAWQDFVTVPGVPWYPRFAAFPGPMAPPMPNTPFPLIALPSKNAGALLNVSATKQSILAALADQDKGPGADEAVGIFAQHLALRLQQWLAQSQVKNVLGTGPVPAFAPPYVPVGPVVGGHVIATPGALASAPSL